MELYRSHVLVCGGTARKSRSSVPAASDFAKPALSLLFIPKARSTAA